MPISVEQVVESASSPVQACLDYARPMRPRPPLGLEIAAARGVAALSRRIGSGWRDDDPGQASGRARPRRDRPPRCATRGLEPPSSPRRTARRRRRRWRPRSSVRATGSRTTPPARTSSRASPRPCSRAGDADLGLFEVDEGALPELVRAATTARGLPRQSLPRPARPLRRARAGGRALAGRRGAACPTRLELVYNADDPQLAAVAEAHGEQRRLRPRRPARGPSVRCSTRPTRSTASAAARRTPTPPRTSATSATTAARAAITQRPPLEVAARDVSLQGLERASFRLDTPEGSRRVELRLPGLYNVYNAVAAATLARALGAELDEIAAGLERFTAAFGRFERIAVGEKRILLLLIKNPAGANEAVRTLVDGGAPQVVVVALNDEIADGRDVSWIWDVDFEPLLRASRDARRDRWPRRRARAPLPLRRPRRGRDRGRARSRAPRSTVGSS